MGNSGEEKEGISLADSAREQKIAELEILQQSLKDKQQEIENYHDQILRLKAEFENYRKRVEKEKQTTFLWGKEEILLKFISVMDIFHQAELQIQKAVDVKSIQQGLVMIKKELENFLNSEGITVMDSLGKKFDINLHDAVDTTEDETIDEEKVTDEIQKGYSFNGRVIRHAKVKVAVPKKKKQQEQKDQNKEDENG
ncbi:MAG: nucleotide exchange factor GrpE [bacterium]